VTLVLLLAGGRAPVPAHLLTALADHRQAGHRFTLVSWYPPVPGLATAVDSLVVLGPGSGDPYLPPARTLRERIVGRVVGPGRLWRAVRADRRLRSAVAAAEMIVALDSPATLTAWRLARSRPEPEVVQGFDAASALLNSGRSGE
jgi:hypothetical protein